MKNKKPFALAGLWRSIEADKKKIVTVGIITTRPNEMMAPIHDRMPVILSDNDLKLWLETGVKDFETLYDLLDPYPESEMEAYVVSYAVNNSRDDTTACIEPA